MATVAYAATQLESLYGHTHQILWTPLANGDAGAPLPMSGSPDRSVQVYGTFGAGGSVAVEGSNDATRDPAAVVNWAPLHDPQGVAIALTAAGIKEVLEVTAWVRVRVTAGDGTTALSAAMVVRRPL
jgi:hypothetical protein